MTGFLASRGPRWLAGVPLTGLVALFLIFDTTIKLIELPVVGETMEALSWSADKAVLLGVLLLAGTVLYLISRTAVLGAVVLTAYLGGAVATHARIDSPLWSHILFGVYLGVMMWGGLVLRRPGLLQVFVRKWEG
ncbi:DoxX family protein [Glycocaulis sp.]|uniref:DoxX family protein n=1 Tax=Glycocaulis sp. TaxID=1969725 RepID=UPI003F71556C